MGTVSHLPPEHGADLRVIDTADPAELHRRFPELAVPLRRPAAGWLDAMPTEPAQDSLPGMPAQPAAPAGVPDPEPVEQLAATYARQAEELAALVRAEDARQRGFAAVMLDALAELRGALDQIATGVAR